MKLVSMLALVALFAVGCASMKKDCCSDSCSKDQKSARQCGDACAKKKS